MKHINNNESTCLIDLDFLIHSDSIRFIYLLYKFSYLSSPNEASITPCAKNGSALATGGSLCGPFAKWCVQVLAQQNLFNLAESLGMFLQRFVPNIVTCHGIPWHQAAHYLLVPAISFSTEQLTQCPPVSHSLISSLPGRHPNTS